MVIRFLDHTKVMDADDWPANRQQHRPERRWKNFLSREREDHALWCGPKEDGEAHTIFHYSFMSVFCLSLSLPTYIFIDIYFLYHIKGKYICYIEISNAFIYIFTWKYRLENNRVRSSNKFIFYFLAQRTKKIQKMGGIYLKNIRISFFSFLTSYIIECRVCKLLI